MTSMILAILAHTPTWVFILFVYLVIKGIQATHPRIVRLEGLAVMPSIFTLWSLYSLYNKYSFLPLLCALWATSFLVGIFIGWHIFVFPSIQVDKKSKTTYLPGSWYPLLLSLAFFSIKYSIGVSQALYPMLRANMNMWIIDITMSALLNGIMWARFLRLYKRYAA